MFLVEFDYILAIFRGADGTDYQHMQSYRLVNASSQDEAKRKAQNWYAEEGMQLFQVSEDNHIEEMDITVTNIIT